MNIIQLSPEDLNQFNEWERRIALGKAALHSMKGRATEIALISGVSPEEADSVKFTGASLVTTQNQQPAFPQHPFQPVVMQGEENHAE